VQPDSFGFILENENSNIYCEVFCDEGHYMIIFDSKYEAEIEMSEEGEWVQADGDHLPANVIKEIGDRIEGFN
jgi:hypothetical protein